MVFIKSPSSNLHFTTGNIDENDTDHLHKHYGLHKELEIIHISQS